jgi:hypothetical protein
MHPEPFAAPAWGAALNIYEAAQDKTILTLSAARNGRYQTIGLPIGA